MSFEILSLYIPIWSILTFQDRASFSIEQLIFFHDYTIITIISIIILVFINIIYIIYSKFIDRYLLQEQIIEIVWTIFPVFILLIIALPSLQALYILDDPSNPNITIKIIGHQWYWSYEYSNFPNIEFDSYFYSRDLFNPRLLNVDNSLVLPIKRIIRTIISATDVIHSWTIPVIGVKIDAIPGRLNQLIFLINYTGIFYGQCSEICGANHRFIPIKIEAIPINKFIEWIFNFIE